MTNSLLALLFTQAWQVTAVFAVVWIVARTLAKNDVHLAHALWALVLIKCLIPPVLTSPISAFSWIPTQGKVVQSVSQLHDPIKESSISLPLPPDSIQVERIEDPQPVVVENAKIAKNDQNYVPKPTRISSETANWSSFVLGVWMTGAVVSFMTAIVRLKRFQHCVWSRAIDSKEDLSRNAEAIISMLSKQLGLRIQVHACVSHALVGPAVLGLFRPTIILPDLVIRGKSLAELKPLIAHELIHIARGDLWWALLQTLATCFFWFHPLVWLASRMLTREAERSCDEQTIASLNCSPADYARCLLNVLECKHQLRVAPALPGVRPVDVTRNRLERIMRLGQGSRIKTPWWIAIVIFAGAAVILPGAGPSRAQDGDDTSGSAITTKQADSATAVKETIVGGDDNVRIVKHDVSDLLKESMIPSTYTPEQAANFLIANIRKSQFWSDEFPHTQFRGEIKFSDESVISLGGAHLPIKVVKNDLWVLGTEANQLQTTEALNQLRAGKFEQVVLTTTFVSSDQWEKFGIKWYQPPPCDVGDLAALANRSVPIFVDDPDAATALKTGSTKLKIPNMVKPCICAVIDSKKALEFEALLQADARSNLVRAPRVTLLNGQLAELVDGTEREFVTGRKQGNGAFGEDAVHVGRFGSTLLVRPVVLSNDVISLNVSLSHCKLKNVEQFVFQGTLGEKINLEQPHCDLSTTSASLKLKNGSSVIFSGRDLGERGPSGMKFVMISCSVLESTIWKQAAAEEERLRSEAAAAAEQTLKALHAQQSQRIDLSIISSKRADGRKYDAVVKAFRDQAELNVEISGKVDCHVEPNRTVVRGEPLRVLVRQQGFDADYFNGDFGELIFETGEKKITSFSFKGNTELRLGSMRASADQLVSESDRIKLIGNVKVTLDDNRSDDFLFNFQSNPSTRFVLTGDLIYIQNETNFEVSGNGHFSHPIADGVPVKLSAERFRWNRDTNELVVLP